MHYDHVTSHIVVAFPRTTPGFLPNSETCVLSFTSCQSPSLCYIGCRECEVIPSISPLSCEDNREALIDGIIPAPIIGEYIPSPSPTPHFTFHPLYHDDHHLSPQSYWPLSLARGTPCGLTKAIAKLAPLNYISYSCLPHSNRNMN
jgi:hypothetical protein